VKRSLEILSCFIATLSTGVALAQISSAQPEQAPEAIKTAPVAYVYVSSSNPKGVNEVDAFAAAADGKLSAVAGSPFDANVASMAVNGKYFFGAGTGGTNIDSFSIASDGALKKVSLINAQKHSGNCGITGPIFLDHTGASLYDLDFDGNACSNNVYQTFSVQKTSGV
jgi:6-phosphogluconolactonase (cycloisomerase 2 family)